MGINSLGSHGGRCAGVSRTDGGRSASCASAHRRAAPSASAQTGEDGAQGQVEGSARQLRVARQEPARPPRQVTKPTAGPAGGGARRPPGARPCRASAEWCRMGRSPAAYTRRRPEVRLRTLRSGLGPRAGRSSSTTCRPRCERPRSMSRGGSPSSRCRTRTGHAARGSSSFSPAIMATSAPSRASLAKRAPRLPAGYCGTASTRAVRADAGELSGARAPGRDSSKS